MHTLADLLYAEAKRFDSFVYSSFPYSCGMTEALGYARKCAMPSKCQLKIEHEPARTIITIKPLKGSGRRKPLVIRLWIS